MSFQLFSPDMVDLIHDDVLNARELTGRALDKSLEGALARVDNRLAYGMLLDAFDLAAVSCGAITTEHCYNDGNKLTAFRSMHLSMVLNGNDIEWEVDQIGPLIIRVAQGLVDKTELANWLRSAQTCP